MARWITAAWVILATLRETQRKSVISNTDKPNPAVASRKFRCNASVKCTQIGTCWPNHQLTKASSKSSYHSWTALVPPLGDERSKLCQAFNSDWRFAVFLASSSLLAWHYIPLKEYFQIYYAKHLETDSISSQICGGQCQPVISEE